MKTCTFCGSNELDDAKFCTACGRLFSETDSEETTETQNDVEQNTVYDEAAGNAVTADENQSTADKIKAFVNRNKKILLIAAAAMVVIIIAAIIRSAFSGKEVEPKDFPLFYANDDGEIKYRTIDGKIRTLFTDTDEVGDLKITSDGEKLLFILKDDDSDKGALYYRKTASKDSDSSVVLIEKGVSDFEVSGDGKFVFYIKNKRFYRYDFKKSVLYAKNAMGIYNFEASDETDGVLLKNSKGELIYADGKNQKTLDKDVSEFGFIEDSDKVYWRTDDSKLYISGVGKKDTKELIASSVDGYDYEFINGHKELYYIKKNKLYYSGGNNKETMLVKDADYIMYGYGDEMEYFAKDAEDTLYILDGDRAEKLCENYITYYGDNFQLIVTYDDGDTSYFFRNGTKLFEVEMPEGFSRAGFSDKYMYCLDEDDALIKCKLSKNGFDINDAEILAEDVDYFYLSDEDEDIVHVYGNDSSFGFYDGKRYCEITNDVEEVVYEDGNKFIYTQDADEDGATLCMYNGKTNIQVAECVTDVVAFANDVVYYIDEDAQLFFTSNGKKSKLIDEDVIRIFDWWEFL